MYVNLSWRPAVDENYIHVLFLKMFVHVSALLIYTVRLSIRPLIGVNDVKPMSGRFK
jgi:hypothetical protein